MSSRALERFREKGAVAVMVAIMATLLFSLAAMSVDLGNAWARKRAVQKQVDVSAISAGWKLPMDTTGAHGHTPTQIATDVAAYLNNADNHVADQMTVAAPDLLDGITANGEITWLKSDPDHPNQNLLVACTDNCDAMRVLAPTSRVGFGFANVIGFSGANVQQTATVQVRSELPPRTRTLPFWLPSGCGYGPTEADTSQGGNPHATATASPTATATSTAAPVTPTPVDADIVLTGAAVTSVGYQGTTSVNGFTVSGVSNSYKKVTLRAFSPDGMTYVDFGGELAGDGTFPEFQVGTEISGTPGNWTVYALAQKNSTQDPSYSSTYLTIQVTNGPTDSPSATSSPTAVPGGCIGQDRGNFGQLQSPRTGIADQQALQYNIAQGLDHTIRPYVFPTGVTEVKVCSGNDDPPGAQLDDQPGTAGNGANCVQNDTGNDGPKMYTGFFTGPAAGIPGRLDATAPGGATTCVGRTAVTEGGVSVNNDTLACFLRNGATLGTIAQTTGVTTAMLDPAIVKSPRFVWLPTVYATDRAQHGFQPIKQFVPGFITEETQTSGGPNDSSGHVNGFDLNGNSVNILYVYTFNPDALPPDERGDTVDYEPDIGESVVKLVR
ncbi:MAG TPA: TadE/TadG family type IV pilus assembly protein [Marmoricola sp.]|nr:TadE/TadG family type IV pilus assembly protein [Marmoricola sp.]